MPSVKSSYDAVKKDFPSACALLAGAKGLSAATWSTHAVTTDPTFKALIQALVVLLDGFDPTLPDKKFCKVEQIAMVAREMGKCNKAISAGSTAMVAFLTDLGVSAKGGKLFFPHEENKTRPLCKTDSAKRYIEAVLMEDVPERFTCITLDEAFALKKRSAVPKLAAGGGGGAAAAAAVQKIPVSIFRSSEEAGIGTATELHTVSRRKGCHVPAVALWPALLARMLSPAVVAKQVIGRDKRPVVELFVPCPGCVTHNELEPEMIHLSFRAVCHFVQNVFKEEESAKERPRVALVPLMEDKSKLPIDMFYNFARASAAMRNPKLMAFRCPNEECLCAEEPRFFEPHAMCTGCVASFKAGEVTYFHMMRCMSCPTVACGLCNKPRAKHVGEREMCPRVKKITAEVRAAGRIEGTLFCPACEVPIQWMDGCPHLTCKCGYHFCGNCEQELPVQATGTRYTHECPNPARANAYFHTPAQAAAHGAMGVRGIREVNPTAHHMIWTSQSLAPKGIRAFGRKQQQAAIRERAAAAMAGGGGGGGAAAAVGGGGGGAAMQAAAAVGGHAVDDDAALAAQMQLAEWGGAP
jgi:hypothetical protein